MDVITNSTTVQRNPHWCSPELLGVFDEKDPSVDDQHTSPDTHSESATNLPNLGRAPDLEPSADVDLSPDTSTTQASQSTYSAKATQESDIYSLACVAFEVCPPNIDM